MIIPLSQFCKNYYYMNKYLIKNCHYLHEHSCIMKMKLFFKSPLAMPIFPSGQTNLIKVERIWLCKYHNGPHQTPWELRKFYMSKQMEKKRFNQIYHKDIFYTLLNMTSKRYDYIWPHFYWEFHIVRKCGQFYNRTMYNLQPSKSLVRKFKSA